VIVLDTHTLIWWVDGGEKLSSAAAKSIQHEHLSGRILISSISAWEIAMLVEKSRLALTKEITDWLGIVQRIENVSFVPLDNAIAVSSVQLPGDFHADPADRIITALARKLDATLLTSDKKIISYQFVKTLW
jgi:PIN domain nuclease of toxin-antitoxin system